MKHLMIFILLTGLSLQFTGMSAQEHKVTTTSKKALESYNSGINSYTLNDYLAAEQHFLDAIKADSSFIEAYLVLAEMYEDSKQPSKAINAYQKGLAINNKFYPLGLIKLGNLEYREGMYEDALSSYNRFLQLNTNSVTQAEKAKDGIVRCIFSMEAMKHPVDFKPVSLGPNVNTSADEYWPSLSADEKTLVITRLVPSDNFMKKVQEDFYLSKWTDQGWSPIRSAGKPLNTEDNEGAQTISGDGRFMVFTACNRADGIGRCDLYSSKRIGDTWLTPVNMGRPVNTIYRETQPSLTPDGRTLYFSSDRPGGKGHHDIWVTHRDIQGSWSVPENLGDSINTPGEEISPFLHPDNQSLYFSSDGWIGLGGYDLFVSRRDSTGTWHKAVNLGYPINTNHDEIGLIVNPRGDKAYYSSDMAKVTGRDIYVFDMPVKDRPLMVTYMKGKVFDANNHDLLRAQCELIDLQNGNILYSSFSDSLTGEFLVSIPLNHNYLLNVSRRGYLFYSENFSLKNSFNVDKPYLKDVPMQPVAVGNTIVLRNVFFETDSFTLKKESMLELNKVVRFLQLNSTIRIEIGGHTDNTGNDEYNQVLSEKRAKAVSGYLISSSIAPSRIVSKGYGINKPIATNQTEEGKAQNRRTEMKIIE
jgi:outer membrane protein OmpA-like peptidoglycan-associated protein